jgi:outer membrane protein insertion porin family
VERGGCPGPVGVSGTSGAASVRATHMWRRPVRIMGVVRAVPRPRATQCAAPTGPRHGSQSSPFSFLWVSLLGRVRARGRTLVLVLALSSTALRAQDLSCGPGDIEVRRLEFVGNHSFDANELADAIVTTQSSWMQRTFGVLGTRRCLDRTEYPRDRLRLILFYRNSGFPDVQVDTTLQAVRPGVVDAIFRIHEGTPTRIDSLMIVGLDSLPPKEQARLERGLPVRLGGRFDKYAIDATVDTLTRRLRNNGFPYAQVLKQDSSDYEKHAAEVRFDVVRGPLAHIGQVLITVLPRQAGQHPGVSTSAVASTMGLKTGHLYRLSDLEAAERALVQTEAFQHIRVAIDTQSTAVAKDSIVDVHADVVEGFMHTARVGGGWATLDCFRTQGEYADRDFLGGLDVLRLSASVTKIGIGYPFGFASGLCDQARSDIYSDTLNYSVATTLSSPLLFGAHLSPTVTIFSQRQSEYDAYVRTTPIGTTLTLTQPLTPSLSIQPEYEFEYGRTYAAPALYCAVFFLCQPEDVATLQKLLPFGYTGVVAVEDHRDNRDDPHSGFLIQSEGRLGSRYLGSSPDLQFDWMSVDAAGYLGVSNGAVLAARLRFGAVGSQSSGDPGFISPQERLYAGGPTTVRGFLQNELGPVVYLPYVSGDTPPRTILANGDTVYRVTPSSRYEVVPEGGNWSIVANLEYRSPRFLRNLLQWAAFADGGQVWSGNVTAIRTLAPALLWTPGLGVRAYTPVGPIRVDIGYNPYLLPVGDAYFNASAIGAPPNQIPLYCVSPQNTLPVHTTSVVYNGTSYSFPEQEPGQCPATYRPVQPEGFFHQLTFNISIGQAF